ncbi:MAG TPA: hypothetical protein VGG16_27120 [Streptosporangiaceae bacterium]
MRHLCGVVLAVLLAAAVFFGAAWGYMMVNCGIDASVAANSGGLPGGGGSLFQSGHVMVGGGALLMVGLAAGLLMVIPWVSPLAAGLPGLVLVAWTVLYVCNVREAVSLIPLKNQDFGTGFEVLLFSGLLGMAGLAMIVPLFVPSRWRRRRPRDPGYAAFGEGTLVQPASAGRGMGVFPETGGSGLDATIPDFAAPPGGSQAPGGPPGPEGRQSTEGPLGQG